LLERTPIFLFCPLECGTEAQSSADEAFSAVYEVQNTAFEAQSSTYEAFSAAYIEKTMDNQTLIKRISLNPEQCGGRPCLRGLRIRVIDVLALVAAGLTVEEIIEELPDLEAADVQAALLYAARRLDHPVLVAA